MEDRYGCGSLQISFCPYCGTKLPENLEDMWFEILEKRFDIDDPFDSEQYKKIPVEYLSDSWWKKLGV